MKIAELILWLISLTGITLSLLLFPGGNMLSILGLGLLALLYPVLGPAVFNGGSFKGLKPMRVLAGVAGGHGIGNGNYWAAV